MRLSEKVIKFKSNNNTTPTFTETKNLKLVVNGKPTETSILDLFFKHTINPGYIKGYTGLEYLSKSDKNFFDTLKIEKDREPIKESYSNTKTG